MESTNKLTVWAKNPYYSFDSRGQRYITATGKRTTHGHRPFFANPAILSKRNPSSEALRRKIEDASGTSARLRP